MPNGQETKRTIESENLGCDAWYALTSLIRSHSSTFHFSTVLLVGGACPRYSQEPATMREEKGEKVKYDARSTPIRLIRSHSSAFHFSTVLKLGSASLHQYQGSKTKRTVGR